MPRLDPWELNDLTSGCPWSAPLGINSMPDLRAQDARALYTRLLEAIGLAGAPSFSDVQYWISQATPFDIVEPPEPEKVIPVIT
jgi:hypothetical protein